MSDEEIKKLFSKRLNFFMNLKRIKQSDIVRDLGINSSTVSNWCKGVMIPRMDKMQLLANYLGVTKAELIEDNSEEIELERIFLKNVNYIATHLEGVEFTENELKEIGKYIDFIKSLKEK